MLKHALFGFGVSLACLLTLMVRQAHHERNLKLALVGFADIAYLKVAP